MFNMPNTQIMSITQQKYQELCREIWKHNRLYFVENNPEISDYEYDMLLKKLDEIEKAHPHWVSQSSPTQRVGESPIEGFKQVTHALAMLSLANTYNKKELQDFMQRVEKGLEKKDVLFCLEYKMDGTAVSLIYERGKLTQACTRGNGKKGDLVTHNIRTIKNLPLELDIPNPPQLLEVRGEVFLRKDTFKKLNEEKERAGEALWANPRNAAAGSLKLLDPKESKKRCLDIALYGISRQDPPQIQGQFEGFSYLKSLGLPTVDYVKRCHRFTDVWSCIQEVENKRPQLPFEIDGVVIKVDSYKEQEILGATGKHPRWAVSYKFSPERAESTIQSITLQVGRTGVITPVAELDPTFLAGSRISRATLHNAEEIKRKDIREGDCVMIEKGGDVIPKVVEVVLEKRKKDAPVWQMPKLCPSCQSLLVQNEAEVAHRCPKENCPEKKQRQIIFFVGKSGMDIEFMGEKLVVQLMQKGFVKNLADIYRLDAGKLFQLDGFKEKSISKLLESLEASKKVSLSRFILALGIPYVGMQTAQLIAGKTQELDKLLRVTCDELLEIDGVGDKVAQSIVNFFTNPKEKESIQDLLSLGVDPKENGPKNIEGHLFAGKVFVLTGTLENLSRLQASQLIEERKGKVSNSVSRKTDYILAGEGAGSKLSKGKKLGITMLSEEEFKNIL